MDAVIERTKPPTGMKINGGGWQGKGGNADEDKDKEYRQNSRTIEMSINDHSTPEATYHNVPAI
ncbi:MAG TPA: hypothetical protein VKD23_01795 [Terriglobales bacterium]|nr:hypothetical protein [Terriglobales bacterium]